MILLRDLLPEDVKPLDYVSKSHLPHTIWQTLEKQWGATDEWGVVRYYNNREDALKFATNRGKESPHAGRARPKKVAKRRVEKRTDDRADIDS